MELEDIARVSAALKKQPAATSIMKMLASVKRAKLDEIVALIKQDDSSADDAEVSSSLKTLTDLRLLEEKEAVLPRWKIYSVTADGLEATRKLLSK